VPILDTLDCTVHRSTGGVTKYDQQFRTDILYGVFDGTEYVLIDNVPGYTNTEQITQSLVESIQLSTTANGN
jgi:hypothetical protein